MPYTDATPVLHPPKPIHARQARPKTERVCPMRSDGLRNADECVTLADILDRLVNDTHADLRSDVPRMAALIQRRAGGCLADDTELAELARAFDLFRNALSAHVLRSEAAVYPLIRSMESSGRAPTLPWGTLKALIDALEHEHCEILAGAARVREIAERAATGKCAARCKDLVSGLRTLETAVQTHIDTERRELFPVALGMEVKLTKRNG